MPSPCAAGEGMGLGSTDGRKDAWAQGDRLLVLPVSLDPFYLTLTTQYTDCLAVPVGAKRELEV